MGSTRLLRVTQLAVLAATLVLLVVFMVAVHAVRSFRAASDSVLRTQEVRVGFAEASADLRDLYTHTRNFLATGDERMIAAQQQSLADFRRGMEALLKLAASDPERRALLERIDSLVTQLAAEYDAYIALRRENGVAAVTARGRDGVARRLVDDVRAAVAEFQAAEARRLEGPLHGVRSDTELTLAVLAGGLALDAMLVVAVVVLLRREFRAREEARAYLESVVDTVREPLVILTQELRVNSANRKFYETFQLSPADIVGRPFAEIDGGVWNVSALQEALSAVVPEQRELQGFEISRDFARLGPKVMLLNARKLHRAGNHTSMMLLAVEDITERKQAEAQLRELNESLRARTTELEAANHELEAFSYSVSHDLRAPLRHIDYFATTLEKQLASAQIDEKARRHLGTISKSARGMGQLIDDLLSFARIARAELRRTRVRLDEIVQDARESLHAEVNGRSVSWHIAPLPEVEGDPALLRQVFANLLANAVKYTRRRTDARIEIVSPAGNPGEVIICVRDNGAGFDMKYADKLFGVFQRLHGSAEFEGTGVGLANVRRIIERHGGRVWAEGEVDRGATFYFSVPAAQPAG